MKPALLFILVLCAASTIGYAQLAGEINLSSANATFLGENAEDMSGHHVSIIGDINGDNYDDFIITAPGWDQSEESLDTGIAYLFYGNSSGFTGAIDLYSADALFIGAAQGNETAHDAFGIGDIDNDGYNDFAIGIKKHSAPIDDTIENSLGKVYIFFGGSNYVGAISLESAPASLYGTNPNAEAAHVKGVGDVDGDGYDDIIVGAGFHSQVGTEAGKVYVFFGKPRAQWQINATMEDAADASFLAEASYDWAGHRVSGVGDVNNDGKADFIVGANNVDTDGRINNGAVYLILGKARTAWALDVSLGQADASWVGANKQGLGWNVADPGDVDNDGLNDIIISNKKYRHFLLLGKNISMSAKQDVNAVADVIFTPSTTLFDDIGHDIHSLGDLNKDGYNDFIIGGSKFADDALGAETGKAFAFWGRPDWPSEIALEDADLIFTGENQGDAAGFSISANGDINNDGAPDLLISALHNGDAGSDAGKTYLFLTPEPVLTLITPNGGEILSTNDNTKIKWMTDPNVEQVTLELSIDNGDTWTTIAENVDDSGVYDWTVPNSPSQTCLVRIKDAFDNDPSDVSDAVFTITSDAIIQVISPNGGETIKAGSSFDILWSSKNFNENVKIELSVDDGATWDVVTPDAGNSGSFTWPVPDRPSTTAFIRIAGSPTSSIFDISDAAFTITGSLLSLNRIEAEDAVYSAGYVVEERAQTSNGKVLRLKTESVGTIVYNFDLPPADYELFVRYLDEFDGTSTSVININGVKVAEWQWDAAVASDVYTYHSMGTHHFNTGDEVEMWTLKNSGEHGRVDYFEFVRHGIPQDITILSPNGDENWPIDSTQEIIWTAENTGGSYNIQLSRDAGATWDNLATDITLAPNDSGFITYVVDAVTGPRSDDCLVKVYDADGTPTDRSDAVFSITESQRPMITVTSPNGGETWMTGSEQTITWISENTTGAVKIELSRNDGSTWEIMTENTNDDGDFEWLVTRPPSDDCLVRVSDVTNIVSDVSNASFVIKGTPKIMVTAPNGGETWDVGATEKIRWSAEFVTGTIKIEVSRDDGASWETIADDTTNNGSFDWPVTAPETQSALVKVAAVNNSTADSSDAVFTIVTPPSITLLSPNGGEEWHINSSQTIRWESVKIDGDVNIEISRDNGQSWNDIVVAANTGSYAWTVTGPPSDETRIKISSADGSVSDASDDPFAVTEMPQISLTSPNGGEEWTIGTKQEITWTSVNTSGTIQIGLSRDSGATWQTLVDSTKDSGAYNWTVTVPASATCLIKISDVSGAPADTSDATFSIVKPLEPTISVTSPNGGEKWAVGSRQKITWFSQDIKSDVKIELTRDNAATWEILAEAAPDSGAFDWTVSKPVSQNCLVRISAANGSAQDVSDATFAITEQPTITIHHPGGGEKWPIGTDQVIYWKSVNISDAVKIQLTRDNGVTWVTVTDSTKNSGSFPWQVTGPTSNTCLVMITDMKGAAFDISDAVFSITEEPSLTLISPNGNEIWPIGSEQKISWESVNIPDTLQIDLSRDNGDTWERLINNAVNTGSWTWTVTEPLSESCLIRVSSPAGDIADESDAVFKIDHPTGVARMSSEIPKNFALQQNYPNPFNPETRIQYQLPSRSNVRLDVYNSLGSKIATLVNKAQAPGVYMLTWNGTDNNGSQMPSGLYFYRITAGGFTATKRMMLMK